MSLQDKALRALGKGALSYPVALVMQRVVRGLLVAMDPRGKVARYNMALALEGLSDQELKALYRRAVDHLAWMLVECLALNVRPELALDWVKSAEGLEELDRPLGEGRGVILVTAHLGNWELAAFWMAQSGYPLMPIVRPPENGGQADLLDAFRRKGGVRPISKGEHMSRALKALKGGAVLGVLADQHGGGEGMPAEFFGHRTSTVKGPSVFRYLTGMPVVLLEAWREGPFRHRLRFSPVRWDEGGDRESRIALGVEAVNRALEGAIRRHPEQWFWQHRRFREAMEVLPSQG
ncbi:MAG: lysophospholipid acyltransferase family protein [Thermanaerothrix sp.]|nr:lysophospholipid acyltransferase family protein [Thermanaerothrix sp.]